MTTVRWAYLAACLAYFLYANRPVPAPQPGPPPSDEIHQIPDPPTTAAEPLTPELQARVKSVEKTGGRYDYWTNGRDTYRKWVPDR
jgi:hypothetical protein